MNRIPFDETYSDILCQHDAGELPEEKAYCFEEFWDGGYDVYCDIADVCQSRGITTVYDIGSCYGFQSRIFEKRGIRYIGIESTDSANDSLSGEQVSYIQGEYPFPINVEDKAHTAAISSLCVGYLTNSGTYAQTAKDFNILIGIFGNDHEKERDRYFRHAATVGNDTNKTCPIQVYESVRTLDLSPDDKSCVKVNERSF